MGDWDGRAAAFVKTNQEQERVEKCNSSSSSSLLTENDGSCVCTMYRKKKHFQRGKQVKVIESLCKTKLCFLMHHHCIKMIIAIV